MPPIKDSEDKKKDNKNTKLYLLCDTIENDTQRTDHIINHYSNTIGNFSDYKWFIIWAPFLLYSIIMLIYIANITDVNITAQNESNTSEFIASLVCLITMFCARFVLDLVYQFYYCVGQENVTTKKLIMNCLYNSIHVSVAVFVGYLLALTMENPEIDKQILAYQKSWIRNISNHRNNFMVSTLFYFISIMYINPITFEKKIISRNNIC
tara:strand:+ start:4453 stop:5079 length:627 start_codon:yes stop_codon:yes gene_type:complete